MGEDPYLVVDARRRVRPRAAERRACIATLKHFAGYSASRGGPQPRPGLDGPARAARRDPAAVRDRGRLAGAGSVMNSYSDVDGVPAGADPWLLTEVLRDEWGFARHRGLRLLGGAVPGHHAPGRGRHRRGRARWRSPPASTSSCRTRSASAPGWSSGCAAASCRRSWSTGPPAGCCTQKVELGLLDPDWTPEGSVAGAAGVDLDSPANRALARELAERSVVLLDAGTALPLLGADGRRCAGSPWSGRAPPTRARSWAATPSPTTCCPATPGSGSASRCRPRSTRCAPSCPASRSCYEPRLRGAGRGPVRLRRRGRRGPRAPTCAWPSSATWPGLFGHGHLRRGLRRRGPAAARACRPTCSTSCSPPARRWSWSSSRAARTRWATCTAGPPRWCRRSCPGEEGGAAIAGVLSGRVQPGGKLPVQIPRRPGGQPGTYLQPPLGARRAPASATSTRRRCSRSATARSYTTLRGRRPADQRRAEVPHRRRVHARPCGSATPAAGPATRSCSSTCATCWPRSPGRCGSWPASPGCRWSPARRADVGSGCTPTGPPSPAATCGAIVEPGDLEVLVGTSAADLPCRAHGPADRAACGRWGTTAGWSPRWSRTGRGTTASGAGERRMPCRPGTAGATLATVAASAGVSVATVSKVLNGRSDVAPATRALVQDLLEEHDYVGRRGADAGQARRPSSWCSTASSTPTRSRSSRASLDAAGELGVGRRGEPAPAGNGKSADRAVRRPGCATWPPPAGRP